MTVLAPYGFAADGGTERETNDEANAEVTATEIDPTTETPVESLTDPGSLRGREGPTVAERTHAHEDPDHCEATAAGRAVVGVTNDSGAVLLLRPEDADRVFLPNTVVEADGDWADAARRAVAEEAGTTVRLDGVERLRTVDHVVGTDGDTRHQNTTWHVLFRGSPVDASDDVSSGVDGWRAGWYDELPADPDESGDVIGDVRAVLD
ncbi:NUDIX domain-containing protein [Halosimplex rubrum]|uniref:NUDIX domain-containing protein n=1 Tax=Halosimplex rubrum TaxID=869889 RepID=A0A7D5P3J5_9EURY|nr:NUDIX domain-containing protein [Halosimplex rubrum]QLH76622.1 NUDIX domain-containing protein [Halosimplex rubrum]